MASQSKGGYFFFKNKPPNIAKFKPDHPKSALYVALLLLDNL